MYESVTDFERSSVSDAAIIMSDEPSLAESESDKSTTSVLDKARIVARAALRLLTAMNKDKI